MLNEEDETKLASDVDDEGSPRGADGEDFILDQSLLSDEGEETAQ